MNSEGTSNPALMRCAVRDARQISVQLDSDPPIEVVVDLYARSVGWLRLLASCAPDPAEALEFEMEAEHWEGRMRRLLARRNVKAT